MKRLLIFGAILFGFAVAIPPADVDAAQKKVVKHGRGHKPASVEVSNSRHHMSDALHAKYLKALPVATQTNYDLRKLGLTPQVLDQGQCGDCYIFSGSRVVAGSFLKSGAVILGTTPTWNMSPQYLIDYHPELGGCNGGDEWQVTQIALASGIYSLAQYPGLGQQPSGEKPLSGTPYSITSMFFCSPGVGAGGVGATQDIKNCLVAYGVISIACAAGSDDWDNITGTGILNGPNSGDTNIDHATTLAGWVDNVDTAALASYGLKASPTGGWWIMQNQWGTDWGQAGFAYVPYTYYSLGTEAYGVTASSTPPPSPTPTPTPTPVPPSPPTPIPPAPVPPAPVPVPCTPYFHLFGWPHVRCDGVTYRGPLGRVRGGY